MAVLSTALCYPTPANPLQGIFVQRRLAEIARLMPLRVVVPIPWFPLVRPDQSRDLERARAGSVKGESSVGGAKNKRLAARSPKGVPGDSQNESPPVDYERMFYLPGILKSLD